MTPLNSAEGFGVPGADPCGIGLADAPESTAGRDEAMESVAPIKAARMGSDFAD